MKTANNKIRRKSSSKINRKIRCTSNNSHKTIENLLADAHGYQQKKQLEQANFLYQQVLEQDPENIYALNGLGLIALNAGMLLLAAEFFNSAHITHPNHKTVNKNLGLVYTRLSEYDKAIQHYTYILNLDENDGEIHAELARLYLLINDMNPALKHYRIAFELNPGDPGNFQGLVQLDAKSITTDDIDTVEKYLLKANLPLEVRCSFYFSLGSVYDVSEKYDEAFANYSVANLSKVAAFDADRHTEYISNIIKIFSQDVFEAQEDFNLNHSTQPVFIVGMPQSGITLVNQVLSNHSDIFAAGALDLIDNIAKKLNLTTGSSQTSEIPVTNINTELLYDFSRFYLNHINAMAIDDNYRIPSRVIDEMPTNFLHLGLISLLFPKAKIVHCVGDPLDVCLSNYFKNYSAGNKYSYDQKNIALYYQQYERLMAHWQSVLPVDIHTVDYEDMMKFPESTSRKLFKFINVDWQAECFESYTSNLSVKAGDHILHNLQHDRNNYESAIKHCRNYKKYAHFFIKELTLFSAADASARAVNVR